MNKQNGKTMSVVTMGKLLGLKKVDSYWLVHKNLFQTILVNNKIRVVKESFEDWYANQVKYHKVTGEPPGAQLRKTSYSARDIAEMLQISEGHAYEIMKNADIPWILVDGWRRFSKNDFDKWYLSQSRFRNEKDRLRDAEIEEASMSMPEMAMLLDVSRACVYEILKSSSGKKLLKVVVVADRKRVMIDSFEEWYVSQDKFRKPDDDPEKTTRKRKTYAESLVSKKTTKTKRTAHFSENPEYLTVDEAAALSRMEPEKILKWIRQGRFPAIRVSRKVIRIPLKSFQEFLGKRTEEEEGEESWLQS